MTEILEKMWAELAKHQPIADRLGYGKAWARMCRERTTTTAWGAAEAAATADVAEAEAEAAAEAAAYAAAYAADAADAAARGAAANSYAKQAIDYITKANGEQA